MGLSKKLLKIKQNKECEKLNKWLHSIKNHINWTAGSSTSVPERVAKWMPILNQDTVFPQCFHPTHTSRDKSKWFTAGVYKLSCIGSVTLLNENMKHFLFFTGTPAFCRLVKVLTFSGFMDRTAEECDRKRKRTESWSAAQPQHMGRHATNHAKRHPCNLLLTYYKKVIRGHLSPAFFKLL